MRWIKPAVLLLLLPLALLSVVVVVGLLSMPLVLREVRTACQDVIEILILDTLKEAKEK